MPPPASPKAPPLSEIKASGADPAAVDLSQDDQSQTKPTLSTPALTKTRAARYSRNLLVPGFGLESQVALNQAKILVVGCGGIASAVIPQLVASGIQQWTLVDDDHVELSNLNRQTLHRAEDIGRAKAERAGEVIQSLDPDAEVAVRIARVTTENARAWVRQHTLVIDASDGLPTKYLLNDAAVLEDVPLVHGAVTSLEGQVFVIPGASGPCLRCLFEDVPPAGTVPTCQQAGVLAPAVGMVGSLMAMEALKVLAMPTLSPLVGRYLAIDAAAPSLRAMTFPRRVDCAVCGESPEIDGTDPGDYAPRRPGER